MGDVINDWSCRPLETCSGRRYQKIGLAAHWRRAVDDVINWSCRPLETCSGRRYQLVLPPTGDVQWTMLSIGLAADWRRTCSDRRHQGLKYIRALSIPIGCVNNTDINNLSDVLITLILITYPMC